MWQAAKLKSATWRRNGKENWMQLRAKLITKMYDIRKEVRIVLKCISAFRIRKILVEQLNNELEITQGAAALEQDEFETKSRRELVDLNAEIRHRQQLKQNLELDIEQIQQQVKNLFCKFFSIFFYY